MKNIQNIREQRFLTAAVQNTKKLAASSPPSFPDFSFQSPALRLKCRACKWSDFPLSVFGGEQRVDLRFGGHNPQRAFSLNDERRGRAGIGQHFIQIIQRQSV